MTDLWIEKDTGQRDAVILRVAGQLAGPWIGILEHECRQARTESRHGRDVPGDGAAAEIHSAGGGSSYLDLSGLTYLSTAGARLLRRLRDDGFVIRGCSPLVSEMLEDTVVPPLDPPRETPDPYRDSRNFVIIPKFRDLPTPCQGFS